MGFKINIYDLCVATKMINGSQMTLTWDITDLKASHKESADVTNFVMALSGIYRNVVKVTRGKVHLYFGMYFDYSTD